MREHAQTQSADALNVLLAAYPAIVGLYILHILSSRWLGSLLRRTVLHAWIVVAWILPILVVAVPFVVYLLLYGDIAAIP
jgi:hypothetical protein